jgi:predicted ATP-grasp superfamily ATP-dependent carboligase
VDKQLSENRHPCNVTIWENIIVETGLIIIKKVLPYIIVFGDLIRVREVNKFSDTMLKKNRPPVIIVGNHVQSLGIIRSLGRMGICIYLLNEKHFCISRFSKYVKFIKSPLIENEKVFIDFLINIGKNEKTKGSILIPTNDKAICLIAKNKVELELHFIVPTPSWDIVKLSIDKRLAHSTALKCNIETPKTFFPNNETGLMKILDLLEYPVIIKPAMVHKFYKKAKVKALLADSESELLLLYKHVSKIIDPEEIMIQELIPGGPELLYTFGSFFKNGNPLAVWTGRKIRQKPMDFGDCTLAESVFEQKVIEMGSKFLKEVDYYGISEVEIKMDPRDGKFKFIEMNPRTWLWHSLAIRTGVDFPSILYDDINGEKLDKVASFEEHVKFIHFYTDLYVSIKLILNRKLSVKDYISSIKGKKEFAVFSFEDPMPFIAETLLLPYLWLTR